MNKQNQNRTNNNSLNEAQGGMDLQTKIQPSEAGIDDRKGQKDYG